VEKHILTGRAVGGANYPEVAPVVEAFSQYIGDRPWIERCVVHVATTDGLEPSAAERWNATGPNVVVEFWTAKGSTIDASETPLQDAAAYQVEEIVEKGDGVFPRGPKPGLTLVSCILPKPGLTLAEARAGYDRHPLTAMWVHIGMDRYSRNCTQKIETAGAVPYFAVSVLAFPTEQDLIERLWVSEDGKEAIWKDVEGFMDMSKVQGMNARTHALR